MMQFKKNNELSEKAHRLIPGGAHTYSKGDDQFPANAPKIIQKGKGCHLWDVDGNQWLDLGMSLGTVILGHAYEPVLAAAREEMEKGVNFVRPSYIEGELAELLCQIVPSAEMVKFGKNGSDATTAAVKLARAYTGRKYIVRCAEDAFNSIHDWFIGSTVMNRGVPEDVQRLTLKFTYNDLASVQALFDQYPNQIAGVLLEPVSMIEPKEGFLESLKRLCEKNGALLIFDEVVSGFRFALGGAQEMVKVTPHLSAFGKAMANGFSVSALAGQREFMKLGGIHHDSERVFLLSTTHGGETHSLRAAITTIKEIQKHNLIQHFWRVGASLQQGLREAVQKLQMSQYVEVIGYGCKPGFFFKDLSGQISMPMRTLFLQEMCARGVLVPYIVPSFAHQEEQIHQAVEAFHGALAAMKQSLEKGSISDVIKGDVVKPVFRKFN